MSTAFTRARRVAAVVVFAASAALPAVASVSWLPHWRDTAHGALRFDLDGNVLVGYAGTRYERDNGFVFGTGIGLQAGRTDALSGNPQFVSSIGWRWQRFSLLARHISNASIKQPNDGETMLVAAWRFR